MAELDLMRGEADIAWVNRALTLAFGGPPEGVTDWMNMAGHENMRLLRDGHAPAASLLAVPMGQFFGGRSVPMEGIAGVAVPPELRGGGAGRRLMQAQVRDAAAAGVPLSCLYASTQAFYRQVGYEQAGVMFRHAIPLRTIGVRDRALQVRPLGEAEEELARDCYHRFAPRFDGMLDRGPYIRQRVRASRGETYRGFGVFAPDGAGLEGYLYYTPQRKPESGRHDVAISDMAFLTSRAGRRLLGFLSDLATVGDDAVFAGPAVHPLTALMAQQYFSSKFKDVWMLRINLVAEALAARGYARSVEAAVTFDIEDELVEQNAGAWTLRVRGGRAEVAEGGAAGVPVLRCDVRGLAPVYAGYCTATQAAALGWMEGDADGLAAADGVFAGSGPWMMDPF
ncbi:MAG: GNAT family N-acetyltransferase [Phycisphaerales bacterium]|nr:GNAT family N-acetyltransferase [Phycisphaerales bacterium]